jgi:hypothetical protein
MPSFSIGFALAPSDHMDFMMTLLIVVLSMVLGIVGARGMLELMFAAMSKPGASRGGPEGVRAD